MHLNLPQEIKGFDFMNLYYFRCRQNTSCKDYIISAFLKCIFIKEEIVICKIIRCVNHSTTGFDFPVTGLSKLSSIIMICFIVFLTNCSGLLRTSSLPEDPGFFKERIKIKRISIFDALMLNERERASLNKSH